MPRRARRCGSGERAVPPVCARDYARSASSPGLSRRRTRDPGRRPDPARATPSYVTDRTETLATTNPLGAKGAGEAGTIGSTPAVVNAVVDALRPYGVSNLTMPCTPERVWQAMAGDSGGQNRTTAAQGGQAGADSRRTAMIPPQFDCVRARTVEEAVSALAGSENAKLLAGGQSFLPILRLRLAYPDVVVDLGRTAGMWGSATRATSW